MEDVMPVAEATAQSIAQLLLAEFEMQAPITRRFLERVPQDKLTWKPHEKSMTAGQLAQHIASVPAGIVHFAGINPASATGFNFPQPMSIEDVLKTHDEGVVTVRELLPRFDDAAMEETWRLLVGDKEILAVQRSLFMRDIMLSHWYQHRGQLSVYLRLLNIPVPASFGPSADEPPPFMQNIEA
jgi:uncharacterized damage-inducible protein DinB